MRYLNFPKPDTRQYGDMVWVVMAGDIAQPDRRDSYSEDRRAQDALPFEDYFLGKSYWDYSDEFREDFYSSPAMRDMSWEERQIYQQGHRTLQVFSNFEDVIEFAHQYRERAISRFERMAGPGRYSTDLAGVAKYNLALDNALVIERVVYDGMSLAEALPSYVAVERVEGPRYGVMEQYGPNVTDYEPVAGRIVTSEERVEAWPGRVESRGFTGLSDGRLWTPIIARGGRGDRGVPLEDVPLDVSFNLTGVWRIPAWNRIGMEEFYEKMQAGERFTDGPEQENWNVSDYEWQIQVVGRRITNFGVTP